MTMAAISGVTIARHGEGHRDDDCSRKRRRNSARPCRAHAWPSTMISSTGAELLALEHEIGGALADIGGARGRDRGVRRGERRRVVEAVADHQHLAPLGRARIRQPSDLRGGRQLGRASLRCRLRAATVSTAPLRSPDRSASGIAAPLQAPRPSRPRRGGAHRRSGTGPARAQRRRYQTSLCPPCSRDPAPCGRAQPLLALGAACASARSPGTSSLPVAAATRLAPLLRRRDDGSRIRMPACRRERGRRRAAWRPAMASASRSCGRPSVSVPVLSNTTMSASATRSSPSAALTTMPLPEQAARGGDLHRGHGERQRAGTGDDEHGDGVGQRRLPRRPRATASRGTWRRPSPCTAGA